MKTGTVYALSNPISKDVFYIGQTYQTLVGRLDGHICDSGRYNTNVCKKIRELSSLNIKPVIEVLEQSDDQSTLDFLEIYYISLFKSWGFTLENQTFGGKGKAARGYRVSKETRLKKSINSMGSKNPFFEKSHTKESKQKISDANRNRDMGEKFRKFRSEYMKTHPVSKETRQKIGDKHKIRIVQLSLDLELIDKFPSIIDACKKVKGASDVHICNCCKGKRATHLKFKWMYEEDYNNLKNKHDYGNTMDERVSF